MPEGYDYHSSGKLVETYSDDQTGTHKQYDTLRRKSTTDFKDAKKHPILQYLGWWHPKERAVLPDSEVAKLSQRMSKELIPKDEKLHDLAKQYMAMETGIDWVKYYKSGYDTSAIPESKRAVAKEFDERSQRLAAPYVSEYRNAYLKDIGKSKTSMGEDEIKKLDLELMNKVSIGPSVVEVLQYYGDYGTNDYTY